MGQYMVSVDVEGNKYKKCEIDLASYEILPSSMNASWYREKNELKITFDIVPFTKKQIDKIREKYLKMKERKNKNDEGLIIPKIESVKSIKQIKAQIHKKKENKKQYMVSVDVEGNKYKKCEIDLASYEILPSSMNAS